MSNSAKFDPAAEPVNLAIGKPSTQSSLHPWWNAASKEADAAQGNNGVIGRASGFNTAAELCPWWEVDLCQTYLIARVIVYNRIDAPRNEFDISISGSINRFDWTVHVVKAIKHDRNPAVCIFPDGVSARFVRVARLGHGELHLDEIQVYEGEAEGAPGPVAVPNLAPLAEGNEDPQHRNKSRPAIACLTMQKDESLLLEPWLLHHGHLFGYRNLYVFDNGSTDPAVLEVLSEFEKLGVNVNRDYTLPAHFNAKGKVIGDKILEFKADQIYDLALPLDCDEFVAVITTDGIRYSKTSVTSEMRRIFEGNEVCRTSQCLYNLPGRLDKFNFAFHQKCIVPVPLFNGIDHGFHLAKLMDGADYAATAITYLHLHFKPFSHLLQGAADKLRPWVDAADRSALVDYAGVGNHLVKYFFMTESEYYSYRIKSQAPTIKFGEFEAWLGRQTCMRKMLDQWRDSNCEGSSD